MVCNTIHRIAILLLISSIASAQVSRKAKEEQIDSLRTAVLKFSDGSRQSTSATPGLDTLYAWSSPSKTLYVSPSFVNYTDGQHFETIQSAVAAATSGDEVRISSGTYAFGLTDSLSIPDGVKLIGSGGVVFTGGRTTTGLSAVNRFNKYTFSLGDSVTIQDITVNCRDSISAFFHSDSTKGIIYRNVRMTVDRSEGSLITSYSGRNYFYDCDFYNRDGMSMFSIYQYNNNTFPADKDTSYWFNTKMRSGIYCYGGTTNGYARMIGCDFESRPVDWVGGNCLNLYEGSYVEYIGGSMSGKIGGSTVVNASGSAVKQRWTGVEINAYSKVYSSDYGPRTQYDSLWMENCTVWIDTVTTLIGLSINNTYVNIGGGTWTYRGHTYQNAGALYSSGAVIGTYADVPDSSHIIINNVNFYNLAFGVFHTGNDTGKVKLEVNGLHVFLPGHENNQAPPLSLYGLDSTSSYIRNSSFVSEHDTGGVITIDCEGIQWSNVRFKLDRSVGIADPGALFSVEGGHTFTHCEWLFTSTGAIEIDSGSVITMRNSAVKTIAAASFMGDGTLNYEHCSFSPRTTTGITANILREPTLDLGWKPTDSPTLWGWWKADNAAHSGTGTTITAWNDASGFAHDFITVVGNPAYISEGINGQPVIRCTDDDIYTIRTIASTDQDTFTVYALVKTTGDQAQVLGASTGSFQLYMGEPTGQNKLGAYDGTNNPSSSALGVARTSFSLVRFRKYATTIEFHQNGTAYGTGTSIAGNWTFNGIGGTAIGATGDYAEIILDTAAVSDSLDLFYQEYFANKYDIYNIITGDLRVTETIRTDSIYARAYGPTGTNAFTTTATSDTVVVSGTTTSSIFLLSIISPTANGLPVDGDLLSYFPKTDTLIVNRQAGTTSGQGYSWFRVRK